MATGRPSTNSRSNGVAVNDLSLPIGAETLSATSTITIAGSPIFLLFVAMHLIIFSP